MLNFRALKSSKREDFRGLKPSKSSTESTSQGRQQYVLDSYAITDKCVRSKELDEIKVEMARPMINGDKVLMTIMTMDIVYGVERNGAKLIGFFDDGSNCSVIRTALAEELGLWGECVTLELGTINASSTIKTKLYCV